MKLFVLVLYICSGAANTCLQPFVFEDKFNSAYDCMIKGYEEGKDKIIEIGPEDVNKYDMYIKFNCLAEEVIIPPKKPVKELRT
jgi:hypothetical protein|tara:strand:- start:370 stop:621 length:252 start_codon:yes stop_codon:yes gene_type:complete